MTPTLPIHSAIKTVTLAAVAVSVALTTPAFAKKAKLNSMSFHVSQAAPSIINVSSTTGQTWDKIETSDVTFGGVMKVDTKWNGWVSRVGLILGDCGNTCLGYHTIFHDGVSVHDFAMTGAFFFSTDKLPPYGDLLTPYRRQIIDGCNAKLNSDGATSKHEFDLKMDVTFVVETDKGLLAPLTQANAGPHYPGKIHYSKRAPITTKIVCNPVLAASVGNLAPPPVDFEVKDIDIFLSTVSTANTQPNPATTCRKGRVKVRVSTSKAGPAKFKIWTKIAGVPGISSKTVEVWSSHDGSGSFVAEHVEWVSVSTPTTLQAKAEEVNGTFAEVTQWKSIALPCFGGGGNGGFAPKPNTSNPDAPMAPPLKLVGDFSFVDHGGPKCTRTGKALISFKTNRPNAVHYRLDCTNGQHFSGIAMPAKKPGGGYVAVALKTFQVGQTTNYSCALKTTAPGTGKLHKWKSHMFQCVKPMMIPGSGNLTGSAPAPAQMLKQGAPIRSLRPQPLRRPRR